MTARQSQFVGALRDAVVARQLWPRLLPLPTLACVLEESEVELGSSSADRRCQQPLMTLLAVDVAVEAARSAVDQIKMAVEGSRMAMMSRRASHDELRREGEARVKRAGDVARELTSWRTRLESADRRVGELDERRADTAAELAEAEELPAGLAEEREKLSAGIEEAETRRRKAADALAEAETAAAFAPPPAPNRQFIPTAGPPEPIVDALALVRSSTGAFDPGRSPAPGSP